MFSSGEYKNIEVIFQKAQAEQNRRIDPLVFDLDGDGIETAIMGGGQGAVMAKEALLLQGRIPSAAVRLPLVRAEADEVAALREVLAELGLL